MKNLFFSLFFLVSILACSQQATTFILVRHAEKADDGTKNPSLTEEGVMRANDLMELLKATDISAIYSTDYNRTQQTMAPLAMEKNLDILSYGWKNPKALLTSMMGSHNGGTVVISGHSNTTPALANLLLGEEKFEQFDDGDYSNIIVISTSELGNGRLLHLRF